MTASRGCVKRTQTGGAGCSAGLTVPSILTFIWSFGLYKEFSSGIFDQWLSHGCDLVHLWTGESYPESVVASGGIFVWPDGRENPDTCTAVATYPKGFLYTYKTTFGNSYRSFSRIQGRDVTIVNYGGEGASFFVVSKEGGRDEVYHSVDYRKLPIIPPESDQEA